MSSGQLILPYLPTKHYEDLHKIIMCILLSNMYFLCEIKYHISLELQYLELHIIASSHINSLCYSLCGFHSLLL